jgi:hypothetical protein
VPEKSIEIASWNTAKGLGLPNVKADIYEGIKSLDADFIILSEGYSTGDQDPEYDGKYWGLPQDEIEGYINAFAISEEYDVVTTAYDDTEKTRPKVPNHFEQYAVLFTRPHFNMALEKIRLSSRNAFRAIVSLDNAAPFPLYGVHNDDRSALARSEMTQAFLEDLAHVAHMLQAPIKDIAAVLAGDLNVMHATSAAARIAGSKLFTSAVQKVQNERIADFGMRSHEMADGSILKRMEAAGFRDAHPLRQATIRFAGLPLMQLDHHMTRGVNINNSKRTRMRGSDHYALTSTICPRTNR